MLILYNIICYPQKGIVLCCSTAFIFGEFSLDNFLEHALRIFVLRGKEFSPNYKPVALLGPGGGL